MLARGTDPDPSIIKQKSKKNLYFYCFVASYDILSLPSKSSEPKKLEEKIIFCWRSPTKLVRGTDPRIRIRTQNISDPEHWYLLNLSSVKLEDKYFT